MQLTVNGAEHDFEQPQTVRSLVDALDLGRRDVAVAVDGRVVARTAWNGTDLRDGATVEVVTAVQGG